MDGAKWGAERNGELAGSGKRSKDGMQVCILRSLWARGQGEGNPHRESDVGGGGVGGWPA